MPAARPVALVRAVYTLLISVLAAPGSCLILFLGAACSRLQECFGQWRTVWRPLELQSQRASLRRLCALWLRDPMSLSSRQIECPARGAPAVECRWCSRRFSRGGNVNTCAGRRERERIRERESLSFGVWEARNVPVGSVHDSRPLAPQHAREMPMSRTTPYYGMRLRPSWCHNFRL